MRSLCSLFFLCRLLLSSPARVSSRSSSTRRPRSPNDWVSRAQRAAASPACVPRDAGSKCAPNASVRIGEPSGSSAGKSREELILKKSLIVAALVCAQAAVFAQQPSPTPSPNDVEALRQQVEALTETVKTLQQQVKDQQETLAKMNAGPTTLPASENAAPTPAPTASAAPLFPTTDESVVAAAPLPSPIPEAAGPAAAPVNAPFPTTDASVTTSTETVSSHRCGGVVDRADDDRGRRPDLHEHLVRRPVSRSPVRAIRNLDQLEVGDHDPQQRGFNARNLETRARRRGRSLFRRASPTSSSSSTTTTKPRSKLEEAFMQTTDLPLGFAAERRPVFRRLRPHQSDPSTHLGFRR